MTAWRHGLNRIQWALAGTLLAVLAPWLATGPFGGVGFNVFALRAPSLQGIGTLAVAVMGVVMVLATRPVLLEPWLGGLDKMHRLQKWLGISALVLSAALWLRVEAPTWMTLERWASGLSTCLVLLIALALWQRFPHRRVFQTHRLLPVAYLVLVFHAVVLTSDTSRSQAVGNVMALLVVAGSVAALMVLFGVVGRSRHALAALESISRPAGADVLQVDVRLKSRWAGHKTGQFAFFRFNKSEGAHPFTITSPWTGDGRMVSLIKGLGDCTRQLPTLLKAGDLLREEGPCGTFNFEGGKPRQVGVGGAIGIAPFIARLQQLALRPDGKTLRHDLLAKWLDVRHFHQELFDLR